MVRSNTPSEQESVQISRSVSGAKHVERVLETRREAYREDVAREKRDHGGGRPPEAQVGTKTWKSYSRIRRPSRAFRNGWDRIEWGSEK